jgi:hypothetical protein
MSEENDKTRDLVPQILISIREKIDGTNARLDRTNERLEETNREVREFRADTNTRFARVDERLSRIEADTRTMRSDTQAVRSYFERDFMTLATKMGEIKAKLETHLQQPHRA